MKQERKGFERLRGVAAMALMGVGAFMGGSARASNKSLTFHVTRGATWNTFSNNWNLFSNQVRTTTNGLKLTVLSGTHHLPPDAFGLGDVSFGPNNDAFDGALNLIVGGHPFVNPDNTVDLTGDTLTTDKVANIVPHIDARVEFWFSPTRPVIRAIYTLTNTSASDITTDLLVVGNYGSDAATTVKASDSGDTKLQTADRWFITSDNGVAGDLIVLTTRFGAGAGVIPTNALTPGGGEDDYGLRYHVTVPANGTIRVMVFHQVATPAAGVAPLSSAAADFESLDALQAAGLLAGLSASEKAQIVNYVPKASDGGGGGGGALGALTLAGLGLAALRRPRRAAK